MTLNCTEYLVLFWFCWFCVTRSHIVYFCYRCCRAVRHPTRKIGYVLGNTSWEIRVHEPNGTQH